LADFRDKLGVCVDAFSGASSDATRQRFVGPRQVELGVLARLNVGGDADHLQRHYFSLPWPQR
jgi:hypothetical protein